jgi:hypothetical protein
MLAGIALVGVVTAALASWFVEKPADVKAAEDRTEEEIPTSAGRSVRSARRSQQCELPVLRIRLDSTQARELALPKTVRRGFESCASDQGDVSVDVSG